MSIRDIPVPEIYKTSQDFRFFLHWFDQSLEKIVYDHGNMIDLYDPLRCPEEELWALADTIGFRRDDRLPTAFNRLVLVYFMSMIRNRGSKDGVTLAAEANLAQFNILMQAKELEEATGDDILYNRLEDASIPVNSVYVMPHTDKGYIDVVYFSTRVPVDACIEYVRPLGMFLFQHAGVRFDARTKVSVDARLTDTRDLGMSFGPTFVGQYSREDWARLQKMRDEQNQLVNPLHTRRDVWYRNSVYEGPLDENQGVEETIVVADDSDFADFDWLTVWSHYEAYYYHPEVFQRRDILSFYTTSQSIRNALSFIDATGLIDGDDYIIAGAGHTELNTGGTFIAPILSQNLLGAKIRFSIDHLIVSMDGTANKAIAKIGLVKFKGSLYMSASVDSMEYLWSRTFVMPGYTGELTDVTVGSVVTSIPEMSVPVGRGVDSLALVVYIDSPTSKPSAYIDNILIAIKGINIVVDALLADTSGFESNNSRIHYEIDDGTPIWNMIQDVNGATQSQIDMNGPRGHLPVNAVPIRSYGVTGVDSPLHNELSSRYGFFNWSGSFGQYGEQRGEWRRVIPLSIKEGTVYRVDTGGLFATTGYSSTLAGRIGIFLGIYMVSESSGLGAVEDDWNIVSERFLRYPEKAHYYEDIELLFDPVYFLPRSDYKKLVFVVKFSSFRQHGASGTSPFNDTRQFLLMPKIEIREGEVRSFELNPGYRSLYSLQLCNNEQLMKALIDPIFSLGFGRGEPRATQPGDVSVTYPDDYLEPPYRDAPAWNLRYDRHLEEGLKAQILGVPVSEEPPDVYTAEEGSTIIRPLPAVNPIMFSVGDAMSLNENDMFAPNTLYTKKGPDGVIRIEDVSGPLP